jgi:hypothetical protein
MRISKLLCVLAAAFFISVQSFAQSPKTKKADAAYGNWQWSEAIELYKKALTKIDNKTLKAEVLFKMGESYKHINDMKIPRPACTTLLGRLSKSTREIYRCYDIIRSLQKISA